MSTYLDGQALNDAIIEAYRHLLDCKSNHRVAAKAYDQELRKKPAYDTLVRAQAEVERAKEKLNDVIKGDIDLYELNSDVKDARGAVDSAKATLSTLLVRQTIKNKNRAVDVGDANPREIYLVAKVGREAAGEQLDMFEDDDSDD